jgi:repressor LexA
MKRIISRRARGNDEVYKQKIRSFYEERQRMPTYQEIADMLAFRSKNAVTRLVERLERDHFLTKDTKGNGRLVPMRGGILQSPIKMLGLVEAGFPTTAEEQQLDSLSLDDYLISKKEASYMLTVKGESMRDAGIVEGDMVIVERTLSAKPGDIVIAEIDGGYTMKYLRMKAGRPYLEPANSAFKPIYPTEALSIVAVVRAVVRKY